jgi:hypothetical protein
MKRFVLVALLALCMVSAAAMPAVAGGRALPPGSNAFGASLVTWAQRWGQWAFASSTNPLFSGVCGEKVDGVFFLNGAFDPGTNIDCALPTGTRLLASPGGAVSWEGPVDELPADVDSQFADYPLTDPRAVLDGRDLSVDNTLVKTGVYSVDLQPGNFIQTVDPNVTSDHLQIASGGWFLRIAPLTPGSHILVLSDVIAGELFDVTFHITVGH